jgi:hypothetical protein
MMTNDGIRAIPLDLDGTFVRGSGAAADFSFDQYERRRSCSGDMPFGRFQRYLLEMDRRAFDGGWRQA